MDPKSFLVLAFETTTDLDIFFQGKGSDDGDGGDGGVVKRLYNLSYAALVSFEEPVLDLESRTRFVGWNQSQLYQA